MDALDGNAIGGRLMDVFGVEMTDVRVWCASCGARGLLAEIEVYVQAPGTVGRCRACKSVLLVLVEVRGITCVDLRGLERIDTATVAS
jgi:Family of unknown function (DUF6510)